MRFTEKQLDSFREFSYDRNPLHHDAAYAQKTEFGQVVVFGIAAVIHGLSSWAGGRRFALSSLKAKFRKPLYLNEEYLFQITENEENQVAISVFKGDVEQAHLRFKWREWSDPRIG